MPKTKKDTVDYFPHYCHNSKFVEIIESKYGNDGYAFLFKLYEHIGNTDGHCVNINDDHELVYICSRAHVTEEKGREILDLLAKIDAIDKESYAYGMIWCQEFVDELFAVYANRKRSLPAKPNIYSRNVPSADISTVDILQSRVEESIGEHRREEEDSSEPLHDSKPFLTFPCSGKVKEWILFEDQVLEFIPLYPAVDVRLQARKALGWCIANPRNRKTARGMLRFLNSWLSREQDKAIKASGGSSARQWQPNTGGE